MAMQGLTLESRLVMPVQRLCRYQLLLAEILKTCSGQTRLGGGCGVIIFFF